jgi:hypothetical protein
MGKTPDLCPSCKQKPAESLHTCPYKTDVLGNDTLCYCCSACRYECAMDV